LKWLFDKKSDLESKSTSQPLGSQIIYRTWEDNEGWIASYKLRILFIFVHKILNSSIIMEELVNKIKKQIDVFTENATLQVEKDNKAAGTRARKASLELEKMLKEFRKASIEASK